MKDKMVLLRLLGVSMLWGFNYVSSAYLLKDFSPIFLSFSRLLLTSLFLLSIGLISGKMKKPTAKEWGLLAAAGFFGTLLNQFFYFTGLQDSTAGNAALIIALSPVATTILARPFLGEAITPFKLIGAFIALVGVAFIVIFGGQSLGISLGDIYLLIAMLSLSVSLLFIGRLTKSLSSFNITILATVIGTVLMAPAAGIEMLRGHMHISGHAGMWIVLVAAAIMGQGLAAFWWNQGISIVGASASSMFMNIPPFVAIVVAHFVLGDPIRASQLVGGLLILLGVALSNSKMNTHRLRPTKSLSH